MDPFSKTPVPSLGIGGKRPLHETITLTMNVPWLELPEASVAVQVTGVLPIGNCAPDGGLHFTFGFGSMLSTAVTVESTRAPFRLVAIAVTTFGSVSTGGVVSPTRTKNDASERLWCASSVW